MKKILTALLPIVIISVSCRKTDVIPPESSKTLKIIGWDSLSKYGGYVNCGIAGNVDADGISFNFVASSIEGAVQITNYKFHINVNDGSKPITTFTMWDNFGQTRNILVTGNDVEFSGMSDFVPEGDNGRWFGASLSYSGIGRNGVVSGRTTTSVTLVSYTYRDQQGLLKTVHPNLTSRQRMSVYSYMWLQPQYYASTQNGLSVGQNRIFQQAFNSIGGDHFLKEVPLKIKMVDCSMGVVPQISVGVWEDGNTLPVPITPANVVKVDDSTFIVKLPQQVRVRKDKITMIDFYGQVQSMTITLNTKLRTSMGNLRYLKYTEIATGTEFSTQNEFFMWMWYYISPFNIDQYYLELYP